MHDKDIREFLIDQSGMHVRPFRNVSGILSGHPHRAGAAEMDRLDTMFPED